MRTAREHLRTRLADLEQFGIKLGLDNAHALSQALGRPERGAPAVLVAGTNGKGSVTAMLTRALIAAGRRTGTYTSPHLVKVEERVQLDGRVIDGADFDAALGDVLAAMDRLLASKELPAPITYFEATTATAFECFRRASVDVGVIEVGLGGRFDATNIVPQAVGVITSIGLDHTQQLGSTLASVAFEKAGIIKVGATTVVGRVESEAWSTIVSVAADRGAPVRSVEGTVDVEAWQTGDHWTVVLTTPHDRYGPVRLGLRGRHQVENARVAVAALEELRAVVPIDRRAIEAGLAEAVWPGRLQLVRAADGRELLIDGAHNADGAAALAAFLRDTQRAPTPIVLAVMKDKDAAQMAQALASAASLFVCTHVSSARAREATSLAETVMGSTDTPCVAARSVEDALQLAFRETRRACAAGSLYFVGDLLAREARGGLW